MRALFGEVALGTNLFRHSVRSYLSAVNEAIAGLGHDLLTRSQSVLNRSFHTYVMDRCESRGLFSSTLVDLSDLLAQSMQSLVAVQERCSTLAATGLDSAGESPEASLDAQLAKSLGFASVKKLTLPYAAERSALAVVAMSLAEVADGCEIFVAKLAQDNTRGVKSPAGSSLR